MSTKKCTKCSLDLPESSFVADSNQSSGLRPSCRECKTKYDKDRYTKNSAKIKASTKAYANANRLASNENKKNWQKSNKPRYAAWAAKRRCARLNATPKWLTDVQIKQIEDFYLIASALTTETDVEHEVDHIIPLQGKDVCGLHVPWNLQVLTREENNFKRAKLIA